ncbi:MAG: Eco57I restriction-modification methylase domain-containing protein [Gammaproteobacteria bacterium]
MTKETAHEHTFNTALGEVLAGLRPDWKGRVKAEKNQSIEGGKRGDIIVYPRDMQPVSLEVAFAKTRDVDGDAIARLGKKETHTGREILTAIAVMPPYEVRRMDSAADMREWLQDGGELEYAIYSDGIRYPHGEINGGRFKGAAKDLAAAIELSATPDERIQYVADKVATEINSIAANMVMDLPPSIMEKIGKRIAECDNEKAMRIAALMWFNAVWFQSRLATDRPDGAVTDGGSEIKFSHPDDCKSLGSMLNAWDDILAVNYDSIFDPAYDSLSHLKGRNAVVNKMLARLRGQVEKVDELRLVGVSDITAQMFPRLAADRKETNAFYTKGEVAELLAGLAFNIIPDDGRDLKIADFACGTGSLLKAAYRQVRLRAVEKGANLVSLHQRYMEENLIGADIQPIAAHMTASGLAGMYPQAHYESDQIGCLPINNGRTGTMELIKAEAVMDLLKQSKGTAIGRKRIIKSADVGADFRSADGAFDLVIMNPPYTQTRGGISLMDKPSMDNLKKQIRRSFANMDAGLASAFMYLADKKLKDGGVVAVVLPLTAAASASYQAMRDHLLQNYTDITAIGMATDKLGKKGKDGSLSDDTNMGEMMIVAKKSLDGGDDKVRFINLHRLPRDFIDAHETARAIKAVNKDGDMTIGDYVYASGGIIKQTRGVAWGACGVRDYESAVIAEAIGRGIVKHKGLAAMDIRMGVETMPMGDVFGPTHPQIGYLRDKPRGAFKFAPAKKGDNSNMSLWAADCKKQKSLVVKPTHRGNVVVGCEKAAAELIGKSSTLFIPRELSITSQALAAAMTAESCMGGRNWCAIKSPKATRAAYCLWFNSIFGLLSRWLVGMRQQPGRSMMGNADLAKLTPPVFDEAALHIAKSEIGRLKKLTLMPCGYAWMDKARHEIDKVVMQMCGIKMSQKEVQKLRLMWCREPSVNGAKKDIVANLEAAMIITQNRDNDG